MTDEELAEIEKDSLQCMIRGHDRFLTQGSNPVLISDPVEVEGMVEE